MDQAVAFSALFVTVGLAVVRPQFTATIRFTPGRAALLGVLVLLTARLLTPHVMLQAWSIQWRPLVTLTSIMILTGVVHEVGAFERLAARIETLARTRSATATFSLVFVLSLVTPSLLNNDAAILILTPLVVALTRRLYPGRPEVTLAFAFVVFLAPGVAPFIVSNPMNMIVAEYAGLKFNSYAAVMVPLSLVGAALTYLVLRLIYRNTLRSVVAVTASPTRVHRHAGRASRRGSHARRVLRVSDRRGTRHRHLDGRGRRRVGIARHLPQLSDRPAAQGYVARLRRHLAVPVGHLPGRPGPALGRRGRSPARALLVGDRQVRSSRRSA